MSQQYPGGFITKSPPTVVGPVDGEGGSAPGVWTLDQAMQYEKLGQWPKPAIPKQLWAWGANYFGNLGTNNTTNRSSPVQVGALTDWKICSAGFDSSLAIKSDGTLWAWGSNSYGTLGLGDTAWRSSPVQIGALTTWNSVAACDFTLAIKTDGTLWSWGKNNFGQLGLNDVVDRSSPVQIGALTTWSQVAVGIFHTLALKTDGTLWSWGRGQLGGLGLGDVIDRSSPVQIGSLTNWSRIQQCGSRMSIAVKTNGTMWAWGYNGNGQLGQNDVVYRSSPVQIGALTTWSKATMGYNVSFGIKTDGTMWSWGRNQRGQLGLNIYAGYSRSSPSQIGALTTWSWVTAGQSTNCFALAVKTDGTMWSWGFNGNGSLGLNDVVDISSPAQVGALTTWRPNPLSAGRRHTLSIKTS